MVLSVLVYSATKHRRRHRFPGRDFRSWTQSSGSSAVRPFLSRCCQTVLMPTWDHNHKEGYTVEKIAHANAHGLAMPDIANAHGRRRKVPHYATCATPYACVGPALKRQLIMLLCTGDR